MAHSSGMARFLTREMRRVYSQSGSACPCRSMNWRERRDARPVGRDHRWGTLRAHPRVAQEELPPRGLLAPPLEHAAIDERPAVKIVIDLTRENEAIDERRVEEQLLKALQ